ncbi:MAG: U32 family peptidase C-terminal domain-containing protein, partial [Clostridia bacterium]|nr:U32 family peptidase C-terminal domain-containing protein [Clostridia bacterium]
ANIYYNGIYIRDWDVIANVLSSDGEFVTVTQRNRFFKGDVLEVMTPGEPPFELTVTDMYNEAGEAVDVAPNPMATIRIRCDRDIPAGSILRIRRKS